MVSGNLSSFINVRIHGQQVGRTIGSFLRDHTWATLLHVRQMRMVPRRIYSVCQSNSNTMESRNNGDHTHHCIIANVDEPVSTTTTQPQRISMHKGHLQQPPCNIAHHFHRNNTLYPNLIHCTTTSTQTDTMNDPEKIIVVSEEDSDDSIEKEIDNLPIDTNSTSNENVKNISNSDVPELRSVSVNTVFWDSLQQEPSTSNGSYSQESINRALNETQRNSQFDNLFNELAEYLHDFSNDNLREVNVSIKIAILN